MEAKTRVEGRVIQVDLEKASRVHTKPCAHFFTHLLGNFNYVVEKKRTVIYIYTNKASLVLLKINVLAFSGPKPSKYEVLLFVIQGIFALLTAAALEGEVPQAQWRPRASRRLAGGRPELLGRVLQIEAEETWREILS